MILLCIFVAQTSVFLLQPALRKAALLQVFRPRHADPQVQHPEAGARLRDLLRRADTRCRWCILAPYFSQCSNFKVKRLFVLSRQISSCSLDFGHMRERTYLLLWCLRLYKNSSVSKISRHLMVAIETCTVDASERYASFRNVFSYPIYFIKCSHFGINEFGISF